jgi:hypothetical protein
MIDSEIGFRRVSNDIYRFQNPGGRLRVSLLTEFATRNFIVLPNFLPDDLVTTVRKSLATSQWNERVDGKIAVEETLQPSLEFAELLLLMHDPLLLEFASSLVDGNPMLQSFDGRIYRMQGSKGHFDSWHTDVDENRSIALSVNLSAQKYEGGELQLRRRANSDGDTISIPSPGPGAALLFRVSPFLEHRVTPIADNGARVVLAGWFGSAPGVFGNVPEGPR